MRKALSVVLFISLIALALSSRCESECQGGDQGQDICCDGRLKNRSSESCACPYRTKIVTRTPGNRIAPLNEEEEDVALLDHDEDDDEVELMVADLPVCSLSCKQVCTDCSNDVNISHTLTRLGSSTFCFTKKNLLQLESNLQRELVQRVRAECSKTCTRCTKLSVEALVITM